MSELTLVRQRWPDPTGRILPVLAQATPQADIPAYLTAVTYVQAAGNLTAETLAAVANIIRDRRRRIRVVLIVVGAALFAVGSIYRIWQMPPPAESKSCYLAAQIATKSGAGILGTGLIIDVNYQGETSSFMVSPDGTASIHLGPLTVTNDHWKLEVRSPAGEPISGQTVQGCPSVARTFALGKDLNVTLVPR